MVEGLAISPEKPIEALRLWIEGNKQTPYKFVGILFNTETSGFEKTLKDFLYEHAELLKHESGPDLLLLHPYVKKETPGARADHAQQQKALTFEYLQGLRVNTLHLPLILLFPFTGLSAKRDSSDKSSLTIQIEQGREGWKENTRGNDKDYFVYFFRCLFEAIKSVQKTETGPMKKLEREFENRLQEKVGRNWTNLTLKEIPNLPIFKEWIVPALKLVAGK